MKFQGTNLSFAPGYSFISFFLISAFIFGYHNIISQECTPSAVCLSGYDENDMSDLPIIYVNIDFHLVEAKYNDNGQAVYFNFQCDDENDPYYAPDYIEKIMDGLNGVLIDPDLSNLSTSPDIGDTRIRYMYSGNVSDPCDAIFIHQSPPTSFTNENTLHVIIRDDPSTSGFSGEAGNPLLIKNVHQGVYELGYTPSQVVGAGHVLLHEIGHNAGLCHSFSTPNACPDLDPATECSSGGVGVPTNCGAGTGSCNTSASNNFMSYIIQTGMTLSQWRTLYTHLYQGDTRYRGLVGSATCVKTGISTTITTGSHEIWDDMHYLKGDLVIETGAVLEINCDVVMDADVKMTVERGGRLFVNNAELSPLYDDCTWKGIWIEGNPGKAHPTTQNAKDVLFTLGSQDAGVVWLKDSRLRSALIAVAVSGNSLADAANWGGMLMVDNTDFEDNGVGALFMRYEKENNSYFSIGTMSHNDLHADYGAIGIYIWNCIDLRIEDFVFEGLSHYAIQGYNFSATIENCDFEGELGGNDFGLNIGATMPSAVTSPTTIEHCEFTKLMYGIVAQSTPNFVNRLAIADSDFYGENENNIKSRGIAIYGEAMFDIYDFNNVSEYYVPIQLSATGDLRNAAKCNSIGDFGHAGILLSNTNARFEFLANKFSHNQVESVKLTGTGNVVNQTVGQFLEDAGNCFERTNGAISNSTANEFAYFVHDTGDPDCDEVPENNLSDGGSNIYRIRESAGDFQTLTCSDVIPNGSFSIQDLGIARTDLTTKSSIMHANPKDSVALKNYQLALAHKDSVLYDVVNTAINNGNLDLVDSLLITENDPYFDRAVVGFRVMRGDTGKALALLNSLPRSTQEEIWFNDIMQINIKIKTIDSLYKLTSAEEQTLLTIAGADTSLLKGYACSILSLCSNYDCVTGNTDSVLTAYLAQVPIPIGQEFEQYPESLEPVIYPNPTNESFTVEWSTEASDVNILVADISGRIYENINLETRGGRVKESIEIQVPGLYVVTLSTNTGEIHSSKVVVLKD